MFPGVDVSISISGGMTRFATNSLSRSVKDMARPGLGQWLDKWFDNTAKRVVRFSNSYFWYTVIA